MAVGGMMAGATVLVRICQCASVIVPGLNPCAALVGHVMPPVQRTWMQAYGSRTPYCNTT